MGTKNLLIKIDANKHKEIKRIALEKETSIQKIFEQHGIYEFIDKVIEGEKAEGK